MPMGSLPQPQQQQPLPHPHSPTTLDPTSDGANFPILDLEETSPTITTAQSNSLNRHTIVSDITEILQCYYQNHDHDPDNPQEEQEQDDEVPAVESMSNCSRPHPCPLCHSSYKTRTHLRRHMVGHLTQRPYACGQCGRGFNRKEHLLKHSASVHTGTKYTCTECGKEISRKDHLVRHMKNMHSNNDSGSSRNNKHHKSGTTTTPLRKIQRFQKRKPQSEVDLATVQNQSAHPLPQSTSTQLGSQPNSSQNQPQLLQHPPPSSFDPDDDPFPLPHILPSFNLGFTNTTNPNQKPTHPCPQCHRTYTRREKLTEHIRSVHQGLKFPCKICGKELSRKDHVKRHERSMHPETIVASRNCSEGLGHTNSRRQPAESLGFGDNGSSVLLRSVCPICLKVFGTNYHLNRHNESCHSGGERAWGCGICGKRFKRKDHLGSHMGRAHANDWKDGSKQVECEIELQVDEGVEKEGDVNGILGNRRETNVHICGHCQTEFRNEVQLLGHLNSSSCTAPVTGSSPNLDLGVGTSNSSNRLWSS